METNTQSSPLGDVLVTLCARKFAIPWWWLALLMLSGGMRLPAAETNWCQTYTGTVGKDPVAVSLTWKEHDYVKGFCMYPEDWGQFELFGENFERGVINFGQFMGYFGRPTGYESTAFAPCTLKKYVEDGMIVWAGSTGDKSDDNAVKVRFARPIAPKPLTAGPWKSVWSSLAAGYELHEGGLSNQGLIALTRRIYEADGAAADGNMEYFIKETLTQPRYDDPVVWTINVMTGKAREWGYGWDPEISGDGKLLAFAVQKQALTGLRTSNEMMAGNHIVLCHLKEPAIAPVKLADPQSTEENPVIHEKPSFSPNSTWCTIVKATTTKGYWEHPDQMVIASTTGKRPPWEIKLPNDNEMCWIDESAYLTFKPGSQSKIHRHGIEGAESKLLWSGPETRDDYDSYRNLAVTPDSRIVVLTDKTVTTLSMDGTELASKPVMLESPSLSRTGRWLYSITKTGNLPMVIHIALTPVASPDPKSRIELPLPPAVPGANFVHGTQDVAWSPDDRWLAVIRSQMSGEWLIGDEITIYHDSTEEKTSP